ncbi:MAG: SET domain-containing protein-lysine N-methyltransferase, partial [Planctomycetaceae bacterium]|nr:SET domain-containing protein-lysine N-methyltransferase [Planctomycetaceae bacterium]
MKDIQSFRSPADCNRVFPFGVTIKKTSYGLGVFAYAFIPKGTPIARISGKIIIGSDYGSDYCIDASENKVLEPAPPFCYLNHSCDPNCILAQYVRECDMLENEELEEGNLETSDLEKDNSDNSIDDCGGNEYGCGDEYDDDEYDDDEYYGDECFFGDGGAAEINSESNNSNDSNDSNDSNSEMNKSADKKPISNSLLKNHSCNLDSDENYDNTIENYEPEFEDDADAEIWVETIRDIFPGEQLTIDYAWPAEKSIKCQCGSECCRG